MEAAKVEVVVEVEFVRWLRQVNAVLDFKIATHGGLTPRLSYSRRLKTPESPQTDAAAVSSRRFVKHWLLLSVSASGEKAPTT